MSDRLLSRIAALEKRLNELSKGKFNGGAYSRGLSTCKVAEVKALCKEFPNDKFRAALTECTILQRDFWLQYNNRKTLRWARSPNMNPSEFNIRRICEWLGIPT